MSLATASVDIVADTSKFKDDLRRKLQQDCAGDALAKCLEKAVSRKTGENLGQRVGNGITRGVNASCKASDAIEKCLSKGVAVATREGARAGRGFSQGLERSIGSSSNTGAFTKSLAQATSGVTALRVAMAGLGAMGPAVLAPLAAGAGALAGGFIAAAAGLGAWVAVVAPAIKENATFVAELDKTKTALADLRAETSQKAADALTPWLRTATDLMKQGAPIIDTFSGAIKTLGEDANAAAQSPFWQDTIRWISEVGGDRLVSLGRSFGNIITGVVGIGKALDETFGQQMFSGIENFTRQFSEWGQNLAESDGFKRFADTVRESWPHVQSALSGMGRLFSAVGRSLQDIAPAALEGFATAIGKIADFAEANPGLTKLATTLGLLGAAGARLSPLVGALGRAGAALGRFAGVATGALPALKRLGSALFGGGAGGVGAAGAGAGLGRMLKGAGWIGAIIALAPLLDDVYAIAQQALSTGRIALIRKSVEDLNALNSMPCPKPYTCTTSANLDTGLSGLFSVFKTIGAAWDAAKGAIDNARIFMIRTAVEQLNELAGLKCPPSFSCTTSINFQVDIPGRDFWADIRSLIDVGLIAGTMTALNAISGMKCPPSKSCTTSLQFSVSIPGRDFWSDIRSLIDTGLIAGTLSALNAVSGMPCPPSKSCTTSLQFSVSIPGRDFWADLRSLIDVGLIAGIMSSLNSVTSIPCPPSKSCSVTMNFSANIPGRDFWGDIRSMIDIALIEAVMNDLNRLATIKCPASWSCAPTFSFTPNIPDMSLWESIGQSFDIEIIKGVINDLNQLSSLQCPPGFQCNVTVSVSAETSLDQVTGGACDRICTIRLNIVGSESLSWLTGQINAINNKVVTISLNIAGSASLSWLVGQINSINNKVVTISLNIAGSASLSWLIGQINSIQNRVITVSLNIAGSASLSWLTDQINSLQNRQITVSVSYTIGSQQAPNPMDAAVNYTLGNQAAPEDKDAKVNYTLGSQAAPEDRSAKVNYTLGTQAAPSDMSAKVNYTRGTQEGATEGANGGIFSAATPMIIGEAGREVLIPLTRPARARELVAQSGLMSVLGGMRSASTAATASSERGQTIINAPITVQTTATDPVIVAAKTISRLTAAVASVSQLGLGVVA